MDSAVHGKSIVGNGLGDLTSIVYRSVGDIQSKRTLNPWLSVFLLESQLLFITLFEMKYDNIAESAASVMTGNWDCETIMDEPAVRVAPEKSGVYAAVRISPDITCNIVNNNRKLNVKKRYFFMCVTSFLYYIRMICKEVPLIYIYFFAYLWNKNDYHVRPFGWQRLAPRIHNRGDGVKEGLRTVTANTPIAAEAYFLKKGIS